MVCMSYARRCIRHRWHGESHSPCSCAVLQMLAGSSIRGKPTLCDFVGCWRICFMLLVVVACSAEGVPALRLPLLSCFCLLLACCP